MNKNNSSLSFFDHLDELRGRLTKCIISIVVMACIFYAFIDKIFAWIIKPVGKVFFTAPGDAFGAQITLTVLGGVLLSFPFILYQIWAFVAQGLKPQEKKYVFFFAPFSLGLFILGALFGYFVMVPISIKFLLSFSSDFIQPMITVKNYISFVGTWILACGITFELPLVLMFLTKIGIATPAFLIDKRRHAIVIILIVSAVITPSTDCISQLIMAVPLIILYEIGIFVSQLTYKKSF